MKPENVLFIGGPERLAAVRIRAIEIAHRLGCDILLDPATAADIPNKYQAFICVKPNLSLSDIGSLSKRGLVCWDILDAPPPKAAVALYLCSTREAQQIYASYGSVELIRHYHCNFDRRHSPQNNFRPAWIGTPHWCPPLTGIDFDMYDSRPMSREDVMNAHLKMGLALNVRATREENNMHIRLTSGIKLMNSMAFGIPSLSSIEPAYDEIGRECTVFVDTPSQCREILPRLVDNKKLYDELIRNGLEAAERFHISSIIKSYQQLINRL